MLLCHLEGALPPALAAVAKQLWVGVDLFFVLSGFLITTVLWDTRNDGAYYKAFYGRRLLRIWPAYAVLLCFSFLGVPLLNRFLGAAAGFKAEPLPFWRYLLMVQNWTPSLMVAPLLSITWSLAVEEQFYLAWPSVIRKLKGHVLFWLLCLVIPLQIMARMLAVHLHISPVFIYFNPLTHGDGLICGAAIAIWLQIYKPLRRTLYYGGLAVMAVGFLSFLSLLPSHVRTQYSSPLLFTSIAAASSGLLLIALVSPGLWWPVHRWLFLNRPLAFLGKISYSLYLYHAFFIRFAVSGKLLARLGGSGHPALGRFALLCLGVGASILAAWISRITLEEYALSKKTLFQYARRALPAI